MEGDEFAVLLAEVAEPEDADAVAVKIIEGYRNPFVSAKSTGAPERAWVSRTIRETIPMM